MKIGVIKEGKQPPDKRVPLTPQQCLHLIEDFPTAEVLIESSDIRAYTDDEYFEFGLPVVDDISICDVLMGVKEVPIDQLVPDKTYFFFSHTIKEQPYNQKLLKAIAEKNITLIDYETLIDDKSVRILGFGRYAGIVGCYNGLRAYGLKNNIYDLKPAHECQDRSEMESELDKVNLPDDFKIALTGMGRVAGGAIEILALLNIQQVDPKEFREKDFDQPVFTQLSVEEYNERIDGQSFTRFDFYKDPKNYRSTFPRFLKTADLYIACHYWDSDSPFLFTRNDLKSDGIRTQIVADISCDIDGPVASTIRPSTIEDPLYGYDPTTEKETDFYNENAIGVMAVDNLPCELPRDASKDFGGELLQKVIPALFNGDINGVLERATIIKNGELTERFDYLRDYLEGK